jgi:DNA-binding transcriptional ArsR family regulator
VLREAGLVEVHQEAQWRVYSRVLADPPRHVEIDGSGIKIWTESMTKTLERLDALCTRQAR